MVKSDRDNPAVNKSEAIRDVLVSLPRGASGDEVIKEVKQRHGHDVSSSLLHVVKSKLKYTGKARKAPKVRQPAKKLTPVTAPVRVTAHERKPRKARGVKVSVGAFGAAQKLLEEAGSRDAAIAVLRAVSAK
jgi:hypothetical protein